jgi:hypothetical protein
MTKGERARASPRLSEPFRRSLAAHRKPCRALFGLDPACLLARSIGIVAPVRDDAFQAALAALTFVICAAE